MPGYIWTENRSKEAANKETQYHRQDSILAFYNLFLSSSVHAWLQIAQKHVSDSVVNCQLHVQLNTLLLCIPYIYKKCWPELTGEIASASLNWSSVLAAVEALEYRLLLLCQVCFSTMFCIHRRIPVQRPECRHSFPPFCNRSAQECANTGLAIVSLQKLVSQHHCAVCTYVVLAAANVSHELIQAA